MTRILYTATAAIIVGTILLSACRSNDNTAKTSDTTTASAPAPMQGMAGGQMGGMMNMMSAGMMDSMQTQMHAMQGMTAEQMQTMLPMHRQMAANMLAQMNREMQQMNMPADAKWTALTDSIRQDLVRMPEMTPAQLHAAMPAHAARMMRLMDMHRGMMGGMKTDTSHKAPSDPNTHGTGAGR